jgi:hypothetical protein
MMPAWKISGSYFEVCNCDAICPCRRQGGMKVASRSTYGVCDFALSWFILEGRAGDVDLAGMKIVMAGSYDDDEEGRPWRLSMYIDDTATPAQEAALRPIFEGKWGGTTLRQFAKNIVEIFEVRRAKIDLDHTPRKWYMRANDWVEVRASEIVPSEKPVSCGIPGHDRAGDEVRAEIMKVNDAPFVFEVHGRCGYASTFDYSSDPEAAVA